MTTFVLVTPDRARQAAVSASASGCGDTRTGFQIEEVSRGQINLPPLRSGQKRLCVLMRDVAASAIAVLRIGPLVDPTVGAAGEGRDAGHSTAFCDDMLCRVHGRHTSRIDV